jgi:hypothetical protein
MDKDLAESLANLKLQVLQEEIDKILSAWGYTDASAFLKDAEEGTIREAENDAIGLTNLLDQKEELLELKRQWSL